MVRCEAKLGTGPCTHSAITGSPFCRRHTRERDRVRSYRLSDPDLAERAHELAEGALHDLTDQVGLMRALIEQRLNLNDTPVDQVASFGTMTNSLLQLTKMTEVLVKLSRESGLYMSRPEVEALIDEVIDVVAGELKDIDGHELIVDRIVDKITKKEE